METFEPNEMVQTVKRKTNKIILSGVVIVGIVGLIVFSYQMGLRQGQQPLVSDTVVDAVSAVEQPQTDTLASGVTDLASIDELRGLFQHDAGKPRLILLVSPT